MDDTAPVPGHHSLGDQRGSPVYMRVVAALVLLPTIPMLFVSIATLALFYIAPTRFGALLARLPGESFIKSALVFAPATLFAIVVLAVLYVLDRPRPTAKAAVSQRISVDQPQQNVPFGRILGIVTLLVAVPMMLFSAALWLLSFVSPTRFASLIEPLPGDAYLQKALPYAPFVLFLVVIVAVFFVFASRTQTRRIPLEDETGAEGWFAQWSANAGRFANMTVGLVLITSLPALLAAVGAFGLYHYAPGKFERVLERLPFDEIVRLGLSFAPVTLLVIVILAMMYLAGPRLNLSTAPVQTQTRTPNTPATTGMRSTLALGVLLGGLSLSVVIVVGIMGTLAYILVR